MVYSELFNDLVLIAERSLLFVQKRSRYTFGSRLTKICLKKEKVV